MELLTFSIAANETKVFAKAGRYIEVITAPYAFSLLLYDTAGGQTDEARNALSGIFIEQAYAQVQVVNGATAQTITLLMHDGRGGSRRQPGTVEIVDGGRARSMAGLAGIGQTQAIASPGNYSYGQLWNPAASGKRLSVRSIVVGSSTAGDIFVRSHNLALTTLDGTPVSKKVQDLIAGLELRSGVDVALLGVGLLRFFVEANISAIIKLEEPIVVDPGYGLLCSAGVVNRESLAVFEFSWEATT